MFLFFTVYLTGSISDFIPERIKVLAVSGYQGIDKIHKNSMIPTSTARKHRILTAEETNAIFSACGPL